MASKDFNDEKPNLRPTKRLGTSGKTIFLHHNPATPTNKSYIHATWRQTTSGKNDQSALERVDPLGIENPQLEYSLNKKQRWELLNDFRQQMVGEKSSSSSSDSDDDEGRGTLSDGERRRGKRQRSYQSTKYRLYELHDTRKQGNCVSVVSNTGAQRVKVPKKTYMKVNVAESPRQQQEQRGNQESSVDVTYYAVVPPPREKQLANVRKQRKRSAKVVTSSQQRPRLVPGQNSSIASEVYDQKSTELLSSDDEDFQVEDKRPGQLQLTDFLPEISADVVREKPSVVKHVVNADETHPKSSLIYLDDVDPLKQNRKFHRQISKEEKLYNRDMATFLKTQKVQNESGKATEKSHHHLMSFSFRTILIDSTNLTPEFLSETYGKNFIHAQCYPTKYLIRLTDRLKTSEWTNKFDLFTKYVTLHAYLVLIVSDEPPIIDSHQCVQVALNMDLFSTTIQIETLHEAMYTLTEVIDRTIQFILTIPFDQFKPIDAELSRKRIVRNHDESEMSESEYLNKQIHQLKILDKNETTAKTVLEQIPITTDSTLDEYEIIRPDICTSCYGDMDSKTSMTALKTCAHWMCDDCWKNYLENSIKRVKVILCPEWNCDTIVDVGTMLSLVNVRCLNIYEGNIEKSLVNLSRSYVKCPQKSCENIVQVVGLNMGHVRCRCGHQFCINCKQEPHFPATCSAFRLYLDEVYRNGDQLSDFNAVTMVKGRNCVSCNNFIEKNGGCNHMTCRCGAEFCWVCTGYWKDHTTSDGTFRCPKETAPIQEQVIRKDRGQSKRYYYNAIHHRHERILKSHPKFKENAKRLLGTIPLEKNALFDQNVIQKQIDKRESVLRHLSEIVVYVQYLHRICEFIAVSADGYGNNPSEFRNSLQPLETITFNMAQLIEGGRGHQAVKSLEEFHQSSEKLIERLQRAVTLRELRRVKTTGYRTS